MKLSSPIVMAHLSQTKEIRILHWFSVSRLHAAVHHQRVPSRSSQTPYGACGDAAVHVASAQDGVLVRQSSLCQSVPAPSRPGSWPHAWFVLGPADETPQAARDR